MCSLRRIIKHAPILCSPLIHKLASVSESLHALTGVNRFCQDIHLMTGSTWFLFWKVTWRVLSPLSIAVSCWLFVFTYIFICTWLTFHWTASYSYAQHWQCWSWSWLFLQLLVDWQKVTVTGTKLVREQLYRLASMHNQTSHYQFSCPNFLKRSILVFRCLFPGLNNHDGQMRQHEDHTWYMMLDDTRTWVWNYLWLQ